MSFCFVVYEHELKLDPTLVARVVALSSETGEWRESFGSESELLAFYKGVNAALTMLGKPTPVMQRSRGEELKVIAGARMAPAPEKPTEPCPCPRCGRPVTVKAAGQFSRWAYDVACVPCHVAYTGGDTQEQAEFKARDLGRHYP